MITNFKYKNNKSKKKYQNFKTLTFILKSFVTFVIIGTSSSSIGLSITGIGLIAIPISTATTCGLMFNNKVIYEIIINKYNKYKRQYEKDQQTNKSFDNFYRKSLQDDIIDENEFESLSNCFTEHLQGTKFESFL